MIKQYATTHNANNVNMLVELVSWLAMPTHTVRRFSVMIVTISRVLCIIFPNLERTPYCYVEEVSCSVCFSIVCVCVPATTRWFVNEQQLQ